MDSSEINAFKILRRPATKATGNPYPKRGKIKNMILHDISKSLQAVLFSIKLSSMEDYDALSTSTDYGKKKARGNPCPRRGKIKDKIFKDIFKPVLFTAS